MLAVLPRFVLIYRSVEAIGMIILFTSFTSIQDGRMQGKHVFQPQTRTVIDLESFIPKDHFLRRVDHTLEMPFSWRCDRRVLRLRTGEALHRSRSVLPDAIGSVLLRHHVGPTTV